MASSGDAMTDDGVAKQAFNAADAMIAESNIPPGFD